MVQTMLCSPDNGSAQPLYIPRKQQWDLAVRMLLQDLLSTQLHEYISKNQTCIKKMFYLLEAHCLQWNRSDWNHNVQRYSATVGCSATGTETRWDLWCHSYLCQTYLKKKKKTHTHHWITHKMITMTTVLMINKKNCLNQSFDHLYKIIVLRALGLAFSLFSTIWHSANISIWKKMLKCWLEQQQPDG